MKLGRQTFLFLSFFLNLILMKQLQWSNYRFQYSQSIF